MVIKRPNRSLVTEDHYRFDFGTVHTPQSNSTHHLGMSFHQQGRHIGPNRK